MQVSHTLNPVSQAKAYRFIPIHYSEFPLFHVKLHQVNLTTVIWEQKLKTLLVKCIWLRARHSNTVAGEKQC